jgi:hypothetical protein
MRLCTLRTLFISVLHVQRCAAPSGAAICATLTLVVSFVMYSSFDVLVLSAPLLPVLVVWSLLTLLLLLQTLLLDLSRTAFTKNNYTFSDRADHERALIDTSHPGHTAANARATYATNRGEDRDSSATLLATYYDQR